MKGDKQGSVEELARTLAEEIEGLPNDGQERELTVKIKGNNGSVNVGGIHVSITAPPQSEPQTWNDLTASQLNEALNYHLAERVDATRAAWLNLPIFMMTAVLVLLVYGLFSGLFFRLDIAWAPYLLAPFIIGFSILVFWVSRVQRVEFMRINESQEFIDAIRVALRRKR